MRMFETAGDAELMRELRVREVVLEICPTSNLLTKSLADEAVLALEPGLAIAASATPRQRAFACAEVG